MRSDTAPDRLKGLASWLLNQSSIPAQRLIGDALGSIGARRPHYSVLAALEQFGPESQADLGRRCAIDRSDMVAVLNELGEAGYIERRADPADARRYRIVLTASGRRHLRKLEALLADAQEQLLAPLSAAERTQLIRLLTRLVDHHTEPASPGPA
jgi:DNA-binding MarR family transcriptional regulator